MLWKQHTSMHYSRWILDEQENFSQWLPVIEDLHAFTKNRYTILDGYWPYSHLVPLIYDIHAFTKNECTILDGCWLNRKLFLTGWSLSSMICMPLLRISTLFWMDVGWTQKNLIGSLSSMTYMLSQRFSILFWMDVGWTKNISHWVLVIHDSHAFTKNQCTTRAASTQIILFVKILKIFKKENKGNSNFSIRNLQIKLLIQRMCWSCPCIITVFWMDGEPAPTPIPVTFLSEASSWPN
jgi:hypothetical protein